MPPAAARKLVLVLLSAVLGVVGVLGGTPAGAAVTPRLIGVEPGLLYYSYPAPAGLADFAGEPSIGWTGEGSTVMFQANTETSAVDFDDAYTVPVAQWASRPSLITSNTASADPILATDPETGRTFVSQLLAACSGASYTDDNGLSYSPSTGCPAPHGVDHQTVGYGPAVPGSPEELIAWNGRMAYYCSQELVAALCGASIDGGATFGPSSPAFTANNCSNAFHGHVKVGPDGTVYLPSERCSGQAIAVSTNNGRTFGFQRLPSDFTAVSNLTHPSLSVSLAAPKGQPQPAGPGVVYYANGDTQGRLIVTTSDDRGTTWSPRVDVTAGTGIVAVDFPVIQAGDPDRAAVSFLGTKDKVGNGNYSTVGYGQLNGMHTVEWHLYVAHTYDRGRTWTVVDTTPADPAQRGCLWTSGTTVTPNETACRNLLDFNGITTDAYGRVLVGWADGCTGPCVASAAVADNARTQLGTITRQTNGKGLYATYDGYIRPGVLNSGNIDPCATGPQLTDARGDASDVVGTPTPVPSEPQLDVRALQLSSRAGPSVRFVLSVDDLKSAPEIPLGSPGGVLYDVTFSYGGQDLYVTAQRDAAGVTGFRLGVFAPTRTTLATGLAGSFDEAANTITFDLTPANIETARASIATANAAPGATTQIPDLPSLALGATFSKLGVTARRQVVLVVPDVDSATSTCSFTLAEPAEEPPPVVPEAPYTVLLLTTAAALGAGSLGVARRRQSRVSA